MHCHIVRCLSTWHSDRIGDFLLFIFLTTLSFVLEHQSLFLFSITLDLFFVLWSSSKHQEPFFSWVICSSAIPTSIGDSGCLDAHHEARTFGKMAFFIQIMILCDDCALMRLLYNAHTVRIYIIAVILFCDTYKIRAFTSVMKWTRIPAPLNLWLVLSTHRFPGELGSEIRMDPSIYWL